MTGILLASLACGLGSLCNFIVFFDKRGKVDAHKNAWFGVILAFVAYALFGMSTLP